MPGRVPLEKISIQGFKSIKELNEFELGNLNVMVGANGAGKSNLVSFFQMLRVMANGGLQKYVLSNGGADGFFYNGPKETEKIKAHLIFGQNEYVFRLESSIASEMIVAGESTLYKGGDYSSEWRHWSGGNKEARLSEWKRRRSSWGNYPSVEAYVYGAISNWMVYHFHDTSSSAPIRREGSVRDFRELGPEAGNIAAFLFHLKENFEKKYIRIQETIQLIAPFFEDFLLEPYKKGENELIRLEWKQKGSSMPFQPWQLSDGTLRFICLATALLQPIKPSTIIIDEPELGLHPYALQVLAALMHEASERTQLVVSTQSTNFINHFDPDKIIVVDRKDDASVFRRLDHSLLEQWLEDYAVGELIQKDIIETGPRYE
ncbi:AAA family ATPase [candidate division KSB1 bacterium]|nr:AAA family ATPase [candidate division KSB1 bacterium]